MDSPEDTRQLMIAFRILDRTDDYASFCSRFEVLVNISRSKIARQSSRFGLGNDRLSRAVSLVYRSAQGNDLDDLVDAGEFSAERAISSMNRSLRGITRLGFTPDSLKSEVVRRLGKGSELSEMVDMVVSVCRD